MLLFPVVLSAPAAERTFILQTYDVKASGRRIHELRKTRNLTQEAVAESIGITPVTLSRIERGENGCSIDTLLILADLFHTSVDYLVLGKISYTRPQLQKQLTGVISELTAIRDSLKT